jgi:hypothetical protein
MKTLVQLVVVAALGYGLWAYGIPWIRREVGRTTPPVSSAVPGAGGACVQLAARASEALHDELLDSARPLMEDDQWEDAVRGVEATLFEASQGCGCALESCAKTRSALVALTSLLSSARGSFRASQSVPLELSRAYEVANQELWEAYDLARDGK